MAPDGEREGLFRGDRRGIMAPPVEEGLFRGERRRGCTSPDRGRRACFRPLCVGGRPTLRFLLRGRRVRPCGSSSHRWKIRWNSHFFTLEQP